MEKLGSLRLCEEKYPICGMTHTLPSAAGTKMNHVLVLYTAETMTYLRVSASQSPYSSTFLLCLYMNLNWLFLDAVFSGRQ